MVDKGDCLTFQFVLIFFFVKTSPKLLLLRLRLFYYGCLTINNVDVTFFQDVTFRKL